MPLTELCCLRPASPSHPIMLLGSRGSRAVDLFVFRNDTLHLVKKKLLCEHLNDTSADFSDRTILGVLADRAGGWLIGSKHSVIRLSLD